MFEVQFSPLVLLIDVLIGIETCQRVEKGSSQRPQHKHHQTHLSHAIGHLSTDAIQLSTKISILYDLVIRIDAQIVEHTEEGLAKASADDDDTIYQEFALGIVLVALVDDRVEGQRGEEGVERKVHRHEHLGIPQLRSKFGM